MVQTVNVIDADGVIVGSLVLSRKGRGWTATDNKGEKCSLAKMTRKLAADGYTLSEMATPQA